jgi:hypothetical protein|tara:strand:+ start:1815 stop:2393 length:579 start_codon:yes stop_codon:yes gene_type:complete
MMQRTVENEQIPAKGSIEATDPFNKAPPGYSLTVDNGNFPFGRPPQDVDPEVVLEKALAFFDSPLNKDRFRKLLIAGLSIETLVEGFVIGGFQEGKFPIEVGMLLKAPLGLYMANMAEEEMLPYKLFENDDELDKGGMSDKEFLTLMKNNNPTMFGHLREALNAEIRAGNSPIKESEQTEVAGFLKQEGDDK